MAVAWTIAIISSLLYNTAIMLQARDAASAPPELEMRAALIVHLVQRWMWVAGTLAMGAAVVLQTIALSQLSVDVMQSVTAAGVLLLPVYGRVLTGHRLRRGELVAIAALVAAVVVASMLVGSGEGTAQLGAPWLALGCAGIALGAFVLAKRSGDGAALVLVAGLGFSGFTILQKELALQHGLVAAIAIGLGFCGCAFAGFIAEMSALRTVSPMRVGPAVLGLMTALPVLTAPLLFAEAWPHPVGTITALAVVVVASGYVSRSAAAADGVLGHDADHDGSLVAEAVPTGP